MDKLSFKTKRKYTAPAGFVILFGVVGTLILLVSHAAVPYASIEAESGTLNVGTAATPASSVSDSNASGGSYIQFGSSSSGSSGTVLFDGSSVSDWPENQSCTASRTQDVPDPDGQSDSVIEFTTLDTDVSPCTPTDNPRSQLLSPSNIFQAGGQYWVSYEVYLPTSFPTVTSWVQFGEPLYGEPFNGSPSIAFGADNEAVTTDPAGEFRWQDGPFENYQVLWASPIVTGQWVRVTWHFQVSASGYTDLYVNDNEVAAENPFPALDGANSQGPWYAILNLYYAAGEFSSANVYYKDYKVATTQSAAEN